MGTDIQGFLQVRDVSNEPYRTVAEIPNVRSYAAFYALAGVRRPYGDSDPISEPRGLPEDFTLHPNRYMNDAEGKTSWLGYHSHSWLYLTEIDMRPGIEDTWLDFVSSAYREHYHLIRDDPHAARIVFGFDS